MWKWSLLHVKNPSFPGNLNDAIVSKRTATGRGNVPGTYSWRSCIAAAHAKASIWGWSSEYHPFLLSWFFAADDHPWNIRKKKHKTSAKRSEWGNDPIHNCHINDHPIPPFPAFSTSKPIPSAFQASRAHWCIGASDVRTHFHWVAGDFFNSRPMVGWKNIGSREK
jgi:hypothetical protein